MLCLNNLREEKPAGLLEAAQAPGRTSRTPPHFRNFEHRNQLDSWAPEGPDSTAVGWAWEPAFLTSSRLIEWSCYQRKCLCQQSLRTLPERLIHWVVGAPPQAMRRTWFLEGHTNNRASGPELLTLHTDPYSFSLAVLPLFSLVCISQKRRAS